MDTKYQKRIHNYRLQIANENLVVCRLKFYSNDSQIHYLQIARISETTASTLSKKIRIFIKIFRLNQYLFVKAAEKLINCADFFVVVVSSAMYPIYIVIKQVDAS